jgi:hypothetical protein
MFALIVLSILQTSLLLYLLWLSVISSIDVNIVIIMGVPQIIFIEDGKLNKYYVCSDCSTRWLFLLLSPSPHRIPYSWRHNNIVVILINNPQWPKCSSGRKSPMSPTLNQKLEIITLSEVSMLNAKIAQNLGFL